MGLFPFLYNYTMQRTVSGKCLCADLEEGINEKQSFLCLDIGVPLIYRDICFLCFVGLGCLFFWGGLFGVGGFVGFCFGFLGVFCFGFLLVGWLGFFLSRTLFSPFLLKMCCFLLAVVHVQFSFLTFTSLMETES